MNLTAFMNNYASYSAYCTEVAFWKKVRNGATAIGKGLLKEALVLYYAWTDPDTPAPAKAAIIGALGYLISPLDAIPDVIPIIGYTDDAGVIAAAMVLVKAYLKEEHHQRARAKAEEWFG